MSETAEQPTVETENPKRRWLLPALVGVGAFLLGVGVGRFGSWRGARFVNDRGLSRVPRATYDVGWEVVGPVPLSASDTTIATSLLLRRSYVPPTQDQALWVGIG
jgi:hypothetical protein